MAPGGFGMGEGKRAHFMPWVGREFLVIVDS